MTWPLSIWLKKWPMISSPYKPTGQHADMSNEDPGNSAGHGRLKVLGKAAASAEPSEGALDHPLAAICQSHPWLCRILVNGSNGGKKLKDALARLGNWTLQVIRHCDTAKGF